jgi:hypothetical protein
MRRPVVWLALLFVAILGAMATATLFVQPPPLRANGSAGFDARQAKERLGFIIRDHEGRERAHPADTPADDAVRDRLLVQLRGMGLTPVVRDQLACNELYKARGISCARVRNVIAILGPSAGKTLLLNAHYDSTDVGPGAADDGIGVATLLEVASKLKGRPLERPIILLFNEGEELGLIGARAFLADPLSRNVDSLVNLEARGVRGPVNMFETSRPNAAAIALFAKAVSHPVANSLSTDVYRLMPNYTDVNSFAERGWLTLNLAPIGNETRYHSPGDDVAALDPATLQHMGDQTLALAEALAGGIPAARDSNRIFMDVSGRSLISLPMTAGAILFALMLLAAAGVAIRRGGIPHGAAVVLGTMIGSGALAWIALALVGAVRHGMFWRAFPMWTHLATYALVILGGSALLATLGRRTSAGQIRASFWLLFLTLGAILGLFAPGGIVFFLFPPLLALTGMVAARWWKPAEVLASAAAILFLYLTWGAMLALLQELLNGGPMWLFAPLGSLLILPLLIEAKPLIDRAPLGAVTVAGAIALVGWVASAAAPAYSADRQQRFVIQHVTDARGGKSWWSVLNDGAPLPPSAGAGWKRDKLPFSDRLRWVAPAPASPDSRAPSIRLLGQVRNGDERTLSVRLSANGNDDLELIAPADARIRSAGVTGFVRPIDPEADGKYAIACSGRSCDGTTLQIVIGKAQPVDFLVLGSRATLPPSAASLLAARPRFARPQYNPDASIAFTRVRL